MMSLMLSDTLTPHPEGPLAAAHEAFSSSSPQEHSFQSEIHYHHHHVPHHVPVQVAPSPMTTEEQQVMAVEAGLASVEDHSHDYSLKRPLEEVQVQAIHTTNEFPYQEEEHPQEQQEENMAKRAKMNEVTMNEEEEEIFYNANHSHNHDLLHHAHLNFAPAAAVMAAAAKKVNNEQWEAMFARLIQYKGIHGDCLVPKRYSQDPKLGTWVETQRVQYKRLPRTVNEQTGEQGVQPNKRLNAERLQKLESTGFAWSAKNVRKTKGEFAVATTVDSEQPVSNHDNIHTPTSSLGTKANSASKPFSSPRGASPTTHLANHDPNSTNTQTNSSNAAPSATANRAAARHRLNQAQWQDMYARLQSYKTQYGDCLVPRKFDQDPKLATWVETQRVLWNRDYRTIGTLGENNHVVPNHDATTTGEPPKDATMINYNNNEMISTTPPPPPEEEWQDDRGGVVVVEASETQTILQGVTETILQDAATTAPAMMMESSDNHVLLEDAEVAAPFPSPGATVHAHHGQAPNVTPVKRLTPERKQLLDDIGFVWSLRSKRIEDHWDEMFRQLVQYKEQHQDCLVPSRYEANLKLGKWVETQRYEYTKLQRAGSASTYDGSIIDQLDNRSEENEGSEPNNNNIDDNMNKKPVAGSANNNNMNVNRPTNPRLTGDRLRRLESIGFEWKVKHKMKRYYDKQWDQMFARLMSYQELKEHCMVPKRYPPDMKLGTWVHTQRIQYRKLMAGTRKTMADGEGAPTEEELNEMKKDMGGQEEVSYRLTEARRIRLEQVGFIWSAREGEKGTDNAGRITRNSYDDQWDFMFVKLQEYKDKFGDCLVPKRYKENSKLGTWVDTQRVQFKKLKKKLASQGKNYEEGEEQGQEVLVEEIPLQLEVAPGGMSPKPLVGRLTDDRIQRLQNLGFVWSLRDDWQKHYDELQEYKLHHRHCNVPARFPANRRLGIWVSAQRQQYKIMNQIPDAAKPRRSAPLTQERIDLLNDIGFTWTIRSRDSLGESWNQRLEELKAYKQRECHCLVPSRYTPNPELGIWVGTQRTQYRLYQRAKETGTGSTALNEGRIRELEELGFVWALRGGEGKRDDEESLENDQHHHHHHDDSHDSVEAAVAAEAAAAAVEDAERFASVQDAEQVATFVSVQDAERAAAFALVQDAELVAAFDHHQQSLVIAEI